ncbi:cytosolic 5'-nucleotidase 1B [Kogia breviceps]|uniref:cytosolic 5'-nucleotidase 1B n=1 Tax=Kogia breviceps TaxID=27615 RepID=UPI002795600A|nr:cytosolic 5'-nucleotidase 1B [Kogia breviceps]
MSQTTLKQKKKNETGPRYSKDSLEADKSRKDSETSGVRLSTQGSQELTLLKTDSRGCLLRNQWSRTSRSPSTRAPSVDESRSENTSLKVEMGMKGKTAHQVNWRTQTETVASKVPSSSLLSYLKVSDLAGICEESDRTLQTMCQLPWGKEKDQAALQRVNARLRELYPDEKDLFDIVLMTNNHAQVAVRLINSVNHYGLLIDRFCLTGGKSPIGYLKAYLTNLYLSADSEKVQEAIQEGIASATMFDGAKDMASCDTQLRVAFDGDAILFSVKSDHITKEDGLDKFFQHEALFENKPLAQGPLKGFLEDLGRLQKKFYAKDERLCCPIRTYLVTARSAASSGAHMLKTLCRCGLEIDEALFLAGTPKGPILVKIRPHIFDDHMFHIEGAQKFGTITAHVPYGINQKENN